MALRVLVCGIHRSGNSLTAHHLARTLSATLLDDPEWAKERRTFDRRFFQDEHIIDEICRHKIIKIPRFVLSLEVVMSVLGEGVLAISVIRNPFDVYMSFLDSLRNGTRQTASMVSVQGNGSDILSEFQEYYTSCVLEACRSPRSHTRLVSFEDVCVSSRRVGSRISNREYVGPPENRRSDGILFGLRTTDRRLVSDVHRTLHHGKAGAAYRKAKAMTTGYRHVLKELTA